MAASSRSQALSVWIFTILQGVMVNSSALWLSTPRTSLILLDLQRVSKLHLLFRNYLMVLVSFKRRLEGGSSSSLTAEVSVKPVKTRRSGLMTRGLQDVVDEAAVAEEGKKLELPLQTYILTHPIPSAWEIRRNDRTDGMRSDLVYFHNKETGKNTAMLWDDRLGLEVPNAPLQALPSNWTREVKEGNIIYRDNSGRVADLPQITDGSETYENVLQPVLFTRPWLFHV